MPVSGRAQDTSHASLWPARRCPECPAEFHPRAANQLFCTPAHRDAWNGRVAVRGRVLTPLTFVAEITRHGTRGTDDQRATGKRATAEHARLIQRWRDEDTAANRMPWPDYLTRRYATGFDPL